MKQILILLILFLTWANLFESSTNLFAENFSHTPKKQSGIKVRTFNVFPTNFWNMRVAFESKPLHYGIRKLKRLKEYNIMSDKQLRSASFWIDRQTKGSNICWNLHFDNLKILYFNRKHDIFNVHGCQINSWLCC